MATNLRRLLSSATKLSNPSLSLVESRTRCISSSSIRFVSSQKNQLPQPQHELEYKEKETSNDPHDENIDVNQVEEGDEDGDDYVNKETGEAGGPKGPEPTRYGDWERKGPGRDQRSVFKMVSRL